MPLKPAAGTVSANAHAGAYAQLLIPRQWRLKERSRFDAKGGCLPGNTELLIGVAGGDLAGDLGAFFEVTANGEVGRRRAGPIALLEGAIAAVEARDHLIVPLAAWRLGVDQRLRLTAPFRAFIRSANAAQEMQRAENFRKPLQVMVVGSGHRSGRGRSLSLRRRLRLNRLRPGLSLRLSGRLGWGLNLRLYENLGTGGADAEVEQK